MTIRDAQIINRELQVLIDLLRSKSSFCGLILLSVSAQVVAPALSRINTFSPIHRAAPLHLSSMPPFKHLSGSDSLKFISDDPSSLSMSY